MPHIPTFGETWGAFFIGIVINAVSYGAALSSVTRYFQSSGIQKDTKMIRLVVFLLWLFSTLQCMFMMAHAYISYVERFGNLVLLNNITPYASTQLLATYLTAFTAQMFYVSRIWIITRGKYWMIIPIIALSLLQICAGIVQVTRTIQLHEFDLLGSTEAITSIQSASTALCDTIITLVLCYVLHDSRTGIRRTDTLVNRLIFYTINRGIATSFSALLNFILFISIPGAFIFMAPLALSAQLYVISVVSMLTSRETLKAEILNGNPSFGLTRSNYGERDIVVGPGPRGGVHLQTSITWEGRDETAVKEGSEAQVTTNSAKDSLVTEV